MTHTAATTKNIYFSNFYIIYTLKITFAYSSIICLSINIDTHIHCYLTAYKITFFASPMRCQSNCPYVLCLLAAKYNKVNRFYGTVSTALRCVCLAFENTTERWIGKCEWKALKRAGSHSLAHSQTTVNSSQAQETAWVRIATEVLTSNCSKSRIDSSSPTQLPLHQHKHT